METIRIRDILQNGQFTVQGHHRIIRYLGIEHGDETVTMWDSDSGTLPPDRLMAHEVTAVNIEGNCMEIEYDGDEYMGPEEDRQIRNINDLAEYLNTTPEHLEHDVYKYTDCGAWIKWDDDSVTVGSIVEGSDAEFDNTLTFPFNASEYNEWIDELEQLCDEAWHEANDDPEDEEEE